MVTLKGEREETTEDNIAGGARKEMGVRSNSNLEERKRGMKDRRKWRQEKSGTIISGKKTAFHLKWHRGCGERKRR